MGSTESKSKTKSTTDPWKPTIPTLNNVIGQIQGQTGNTAVTGNENAALDTLTNNAKAGNVYAPKIGNLATDLFAGGASSSGGLSPVNNFMDYKAALTPTATAESNPWANPAFAKAAGYITDDVTNRIKAEYAGAGRDPSGAGSFGLNLGEGIARGLAPTWLQAYNDMEGRKLGAIDSIFTGGNQAVQTDLNNRMAGIDVGNKALQANDAGANQLLGVEAQRRNLPLGNIGNIESLIAPLAQLGQQGTSTTNASVTPPLGMQVAQVASAFKAPGAGWGAGK